MMDSGPRLHAWESGLDFIWTTETAVRVDTPVADHLVAEGIDP